MKHVRNGLGAWGWLGVGAVTLAAGYAFLHLAILAGRGGEAMPIYSVQRFDPYGTAALHRLFERRLNNVETLERPRLNHTHRGVLVQVLPMGEASREQQVESDALDEWPVPAEVYALPAGPLMEWVAQGNTLIQLTRGHTDVMESLGLQPESHDAGQSFLTDVRLELEHEERRGEAPDNQPGQALTALWSTPDAPHRLTLHEPRTFAEIGPQGWTPLLRHGSRVYGGVLTHGQGLVIVVGSPTPALNHMLGDADHLAWWIAQVGDGPVIFDEWAHGVGHAGTVLETLAYFGLIPLLLQIGVWLGVYRWSSAGRVTTDLHDNAPITRTSAEQIDTLARLYDHAWGTPELGRRVHDEILTRLADALRCEPAMLRTRLDHHPAPAARQAIALLDHARAAAALPPPRCPQCRYPLRGLAGNHCPECGSTLPRQVRRRVAPAEWLDHPDADAPPTRRFNTTQLADLLNRSADLAQELSRVRQR